MLIFSTNLPVVKGFDRKKFVDMCIEWNQGGKDPIDGINWDGSSYHHRWGDESTILEVTSLDSITAMRFTKNDMGVIWTTEFILNSDNNTIGIYLNRSATEDAVYFRPSFKPPYFLKMLYRKRLLGKDDGMEISDLPLPIYNKDKELKLLAKWYNEGAIGVSLPIVYLSMNWGTKQYSVDPKRLSHNLLGVAHVCIEEDNEISGYLKDMCNGRNVYNGGIAIFYPSQSADIKKYIPYDGMDEQKLLDNITRTVFRYMNQQRRERLETWDGIQLVQLKRKTDKLSKEKNDVEKNSRESDEVWKKLLDEQQLQIDELTRQNENLQGEVSNLRAWTDSLGEKPLIFYGDEQEFYRDEFKEYVLTALESAINKTDKRKDKRKRWVDVLQSILDANECDFTQKQRKDDLKCVLNDYRTMTSNIRTALIDAGFKITDDGKHYKLTYYDDERYVMSMSKTSSDCRAGKNFFHELKAMIYE